jgi:hypothetical protein
MHAVGRLLLPLLIAASTPGAWSTPAIAGAAPALVDALRTKQLIGITATGPQADLDRLQAFAVSSGFPNKQMDSPDGWELFVVFPPSSNASDVAAFLDRLRGSEFSTLQVRSAIAPASP